MSRLEQKKASRLRFLNAMYEAIAEQGEFYVSSYDIGEQLGISRNDAQDVVDYLIGEGLIKRFTAMGGVQLTHEGHVQVEKARSRPEEPTDRFPPAGLILNVGTMVNSQIQQGSAGATQSFHATQSDLARVGEFVEAFAKALRESDWSGDDRAVAESDLAVLRAQIQSPKPKLGMITEALGSLRTVLEGTMGNMLATVWLPPLVALLADYRIP